MTQLSVRLGDDLGDEVEHDHQGRRHPEQPSFSGAWHPLPSPSHSMQKPRVRQRVEPLERRSPCRSCGTPELLGRAVQPAQRLVDVPEEPAFLRREEERLLPLHRVGALVGHVERVGGQVAVGRLVAGLELVRRSGPAPSAPRALFQQPLLEVLELLLRIIGSYPS